MIVATWNVNGIRAREAQFLEWLAREKADVVCLQEIKATPDQISLVLATLPDYASFWHGGAKGYSGVSLHIRKSSFEHAPEFSHPRFDAESRIVQARVGEYVFASVYVPNGGKDYAAKVAFMKEMAVYAAECHADGRTLVLAGDMNVARAERDVHPSQRKDIIGQLPEERDLFEAILRAGLVDVGRALEPDNDRIFTWWPYWRNARERNLGWRLDYVLASEKLASRARSTFVRADVGTSDHAPVIVTFEVA